MRCRLGWPARNKLRGTVGTLESGNRPQVIAPAGAAEPLHGRLQSLAHYLIAARATPDQTIAYSVEVTGECPERLHDALVRIATELVDHALRHGLALRQRGCIEIVLMKEPDGSIELAIRDNGWQPLSHAWTGEDSRAVRTLSSLHRGKFALRRQNEWTEAVVKFPSQPIDPLGRTVLGYSVGLLGIVWAAIALQNGAHRGVHSMRAASVCMASVVLISGSECPANYTPPLSMHSSGSRRGSSAVQSLAHPL